MRVRVAGRDGLHAERLGEVAQGREAPRVAALEGPLKLDEETLRAERPREGRCAVRVAYREAVPGAAREADEAVVQLRQQHRVERGRQGVAALLRARARVCRRQQ